MIRNTKPATCVRNARCAARVVNHVRIVYAQRSSACSSRHMVAWPMLNGQYQSSHTLIDRLTLCDRRAELALQRCKQIEAAWAEHLPHISLESALERPNEATERSPGSPSRWRDSLAAGAEALSSRITRSPGSNGDADTSVVAADELETSDAYQNLDWDESQNTVSLATGRGSLSVQTHGLGYMGFQSGNALLRTLQPFHGVLLTDAIEDANYWASDVQLGEQTLRSSAFSSRCVDAYFKYYHHMYPILHEGEFRAQWMGVLSKPQDGSWPVLYNAILALGARSGEFSRQKADEYFYQQSRQHLSWDLLLRGSLPLVQALVLLADYLQKCNRPNSAFTLLGAALNMALSIGLHKEFFTDAANIQVMEIRRRTWWILSTFDADARLSFGRPALVLRGANISVPCNIDDGDLPADIQTLPAPKDYTTVTSCLIWQTKLAEISHRINQVLNARVRSDDAAVSRLNLQLHEWSSGLPQHMTKRSEDLVEDIFEIPRTILLWRSIHLRITLHRPYILASIKQRTPLLPPDQQTNHADCLTAVSESIQAITSFWSFTTARHGFFVWYAGQCLITAVFVHIACLLYAPTHTASHDWRHHIQLARITLEGMSQYELNALRAVRVIDQLLCQKNPAYHDKGEGKADKKFIGLVPTSPDSNFSDTNEHLRMVLDGSWNGGWDAMNLYQDDPVSVTPLI